MPFVELPTLPPYGKISLNPDTIFVAIADAADPAGSSNLLVDAAGGRRIFVTEDIETVGRKLGSSFVQLRTAAIHPVPCFVNRHGVVSLTPHPQVPMVVQIHGSNRYIAVQGSMDEVQAAFD